MKFEPRGDAEELEWQQSPEAQIVRRSNKLRNVYLVMLDLWNSGKCKEAAEFYRTVDDGQKFMWGYILRSHHGDKGHMQFDRVLFDLMHPVSQEAQDWLDAAKKACNHDNSSSR